MKTLYYIFMVVENPTISSYGHKPMFVAGENDVENGGSADGDGYQFESKEDAEKTMQQLRVYAKEKGYNYRFFIDNFEIEEECDNIHKMYEDFEALQHNAFYELYSEEDWDYCNTHTLEQAIEEDYQPTTHF